MCLFPLAGYKGLVIQLKFRLIIHVGSHLHFMYIMCLIFQFFAFFSGIRGLRVQSDGGGGQAGVGEGGDVQGDRVSTLSTELG